MFKKILIGLIAAMIVFVVVVALQPSSFRVERSATIAAPPADVFAQVNDFHKWQEWSPWAELDPNASARFEGPDAGVGAIFHWAGNDEVGEGDMKITESRPFELIRLNLHFVKPFEDLAVTEFTFKPTGEDERQTLVTWTMTGESGFVQRAICLFMDMDEMVGKDFERGLANIKAAVETRPAE